TVTYQAAVPAAKKMRIKLHDKTVVDFEEQSWRRTTLSPQAGRGGCIYNAPMKRAIVIVCDSLGVGELPDAADFGDEGSNTLGHVLRDQHPRLPNLTRLGLLHTLPHPATNESPQSAFGRMAELSAGKDTTTRHWEMMGLIVKDP